MPALWDNTVVLDLVVPSNGQLAPKSGTIYIGGPRLPTDLVTAGYKSAIVFYSSVNDANDVEYWFEGINSSLTGSTLEYGVKLVGQPIILYNEFSRQITVNGVQQNEQVDTYLLNAANTIGITNPIIIEANGGIEIKTATSIFFEDYFLSLSELASFNNLGIAPVVKAVASSTVDVWSGQQTFLNQNINGVLSTTRWNWYMSIDWRVELHFQCRTNAGNYPAVNFLTIPIPAALNLPSPAPQTAPVEGPYGMAQANGWPTMLRIDSPATQMFAFINLNPNASPFVTGTISYQAVKP